MVKKDRPVFIMDVVPGGLRPATAYDEEGLSAYRIGSQIEVTLYQGKSRPQERLLWGFAAFVCDATGRWPNKEALIAAVLTQLGYVDSFMALRGGDILTQPASLSAMDAPTFKKFCQEAFDLILDQVGVDVGDYTAFMASKKAR